MASPHSFIIGVVFGSFGLLSCAESSGSQPVISPATSPAPPPVTSRIDLAHEGSLSSASVATPAPPPRVCDALSFVSPPRVDGADKPYTETPGGPTQGAGDLNGDGTPEVAVVYNETTTTMATTILKKQDVGDCFTPLYAGRGLIARVLSTRTNGWLDIELTVAARNPAKGFSLGGATVLATFDGSRYVWSRNLGCGYLEGKLPVKQCDEVVRAANPGDRVLPWK